MIKTTAVIPNYNGIEYLENCINSLLASNVDIKIIVVDNGSTDGAVELVKSKFPMVDLVELKNNTGFCHAVNVGISLSTTPYVFLINNDAFVDKNTIKMLEDTIESDEKLFSVQAKMLQHYNRELVDSAGDLYCALGWAFSVGKDQHKDKYTGIKQIFSACGGASLYRKEILDKIGLFDENHFAYLEDVDIGYRAIINGYKNVVNQDALVYHAGSGTTGSRHNEFKVRLSSKNSIYLIYKNMPLIQLIVNLPILFIGYMIKTVFFIKKGLGLTYIKGVLEGIGFCFTKEARNNKIRYKSKRLSTYIAIEVILLINCIKRFLG